MKPKYKTSLFATALLLLGACSDSDWQPGPEETPNMGVYFGEQSTYDLLVLDDEDRHFTAKVTRNETDEAATVPLKVISCPEGVTVPTSVEFAEGQETATFQIDLMGMPLSTTGNVQIEIDPEYTSTYAAGNSLFNLKVTVSAGWQVLADDLLIDYSENTYEYPNQETKLYILDGTKRFKVENFEDSGIDFIFTVENPDATRPKIVPYTNCVMWADLYDSDDYHCWYLYDTAKAEYPSWTPYGIGPKIVDFYFYGWDDSKTYTYIWFDYDGEGNGYAYISTATEYDDGTYGYGDCEFWFTPKYNPFAE